MPAHFTFEVHTPHRLFFSERVEAVTLTLLDGEICVYAKHSAFTAPVLCCILQIKDGNGRWRHAFITDGILEVKEHKTVLMVDVAEWPEEIDPKRARAAKEHAEASLKTAALKFEVENAKAKIRRAEFRLKASELKS